MAVEERTTGLGMENERDNASANVGDAAAGQIGERQIDDRQIDDGQIDDGQIGDTIRIRKPPRVFTNTLGQNIWMGEVEPCELELETPTRTNPYDSGTTDDPWAQVPR